MAMNSGRRMTPFSPPCCAPGTTSMRICGYAAEKVGTPGAAESSLPMIVIIGTRQGAIFDDEEPIPAPESRERLHVVDGRRHHLSHFVFGWRRRTWRLQREGERPKRHVALELINFPDATHRVQVTNAKELTPAIRDFIMRPRALLDVCRADSDTALGSCI